MSIEEKFEKWYAKNHNSNRVNPLQLDREGYYHHQETKLAFSAFLAGYKANTKLELI